MTSLLDMLDAIERDKPRSVYCTQNGEDCATCSLSSCGMDCHGNPFDYGEPDKDD